jgi:hypothetical protein
MDPLTHPVQDGNTIIFYCKNYNETPQLLSEFAR